MNCFDELGMDPLSTTGRLTGVSNSALMCSAFLLVVRLGPKAPGLKAPKRVQSLKASKPQSIEAPTGYRAYDLVIGRVEMAESVSKEEQGRDSAVVWRRVRLAIQHGFSHLS